MEVSVWHHSSGEVVYQGNVCEPEVLVGFQVSEARVKFSEGNSQRQNE